MTGISESRAVFCPKSVTELPENTGKCTFGAELCRKSAEKCHDSDRRKDSVVKNEIF